MEWSDAKQQVFRFERNTAVSAGAGSGKTAVLVELYLRLLAGETSLGRPLAVEEIAAITFTDKAAVEMKERVRSGIRKRLAQGDTVADWERVARSLPNAAISTFHAFCARILRENPAEAGVDPAFIMLDDLTSGSDLSAALDEVIEGELAAKSAEIRRLLQFFPLSGRGRGKGIREHLAHLHSKRYGSATDDRALLQMAEQWNTDAAALFTARLKELQDLVTEVERILAGKESAFHGKLRSLPGIFQRAPLSLDSDETPLLLDAMEESIAGTWGKEKPVKDALLDSLAALKPSYWQIRSAPVVADLLSLAGKLETAYRLRKERRGALDFEDLQVKSRDLLRRDGRLREEYRQRFAVVMVDEFQDTNPLQKELIDLVCGEGQRLFLVGDPKQSIYLFRGADVSVFTRALSETAERGGETLYFQESFRSRQGIIAFVNALFGRTVMVGGDADFETDYGPGDHLDPQRKDRDDNPCVELLTVTHGENSAERRALEAAALAQMIIRLVSGEDNVNVFDRAGRTGDQGPGTGTANLEPDFSPRTPRFGDIAILFRRFSNLKLFERELRKCRIPYYVVKGKGFYRCQEVLDILNFLRNLEFGGDLVALTGILRSPLCSVSDETLFLLSRLEGGIGSWEKWFARLPVPDSRSLILGRITQRDRERLESFARLISRLRPLRDRLTLAELLEEIITGTDFASTLLTTFQGEQKVANLRKLIELARSFGERSDGTLRRFTTYLTELVETEPTEAEAVISAEGEDVVRLMTVHQSKGLEFPIVIAPELGAQPPFSGSPVQFDESLGLGVRLALPGKEGEASLAHLEIAALRKRKEAAETKRLFYVAVTRARDYLILSGEGRGEWRRWVDAFREGEDAGLMGVVDAATFLGDEVSGERPLTAGRETRHDLHADLIAAAIRRSLSFEPPRPSEMVFSPTALEDYATCPRKYFYKAVMGLDEGLFAGLLGTHSGRMRTKREGMTSLEKGNLAHAMLEKLDFTAALPLQREVCEKIAARACTGQPEEDVAEVVAAVLAHAASPLAREVARMRLLREHPFILRFSGDATYYVKGAMDLVAEGEDGVTVYDYKYAKKEHADLDGYRFQIRTYMLALAKVYPGRPIRGKLLFLMGGGTAEVTCDVTAFERHLLEIMDAIRGRSGEEEFALREECDGRHCPFRERCLTRE